MGIDKEALVKSQLLGAEIERTMDVISTAWDSKNLSLEDMCDHLDELIEVVKGQSTFTEFTETTNLTGFEKLN